MKKKERRIIESKVNKQLKLLITLFLLSWCPVGLIYYGEVSALLMIDFAILLVSFVVSLLFFINIYRLYFSKLHFQLVAILGAIFIGAVIFIFFTPIMTVFEFQIIQ